MDSCKHLSKIKKWNHSILNPQKWMCYFCGTTESVWACLSCPSVACGRYNEEHALKHYQEKQKYGGDCIQVEYQCRTKWEKAFVYIQAILDCQHHPLCIEVNERYVYCYECDDYVLNDNASGDLKILRSALSAIATQSFTDVESRGRRLLRSYSQTTVTSPTQSDEDDKLVTADFHRRKCLLRKIFTAWRQLNQQKRIVEQQRTPEKRTTAFSLNDNDSSPGASPFLKRRTIIPGITGLRNLGNTCYMNSVLQVLSHLSSFREFFIKRVDPSPSRVTTPDSTPINSIFNTSQHLRSQVEATTPPHHSVTASCASPSATSCATPTFTPTRFLSRQTTFECFEHLMTPVSSKTKKIPAGGLNGGSLHGTSLRKKLICSVEKKELSQSNMSLCQELNGLFRVLWSGRWAQVSPHAFLQAVWQHIPAFKGHAQHDAQEFLCEMLDKVQTELESRNMSTVNADIINDIFRGQLVSQVKCLQCNNISERTEPFLDLSLEFPERYQITQENSSIAQDVCHITEMMYTFTEIEKLDGKIYCCEKCNANRSQKSPKSPIYTHAQKQFLVGKLPSILRLHLKRFRWSGRLHREKISTSVGINDVLDMQPFCTDSVSNSSGYMYNLLGVIVHHGRGFGSGHYTAYCWNSEAESWVHCNDSRMKLCSLEEVLQSQSYILVYTHVPRDSKTSSEHVKSGSDFQCSESEGRISQEIDDDITFNFKPPPENERLIKRKFRDRELLDTERVIKRRRSTLW